MTRTDIANLALIKCGQSVSIADIQDAVHPAPLLNTVFDHCVKHVQSSMSWPELAATEVLTAEEDQTPDNLYQFELPDDCLRIERVTDSSFVLVFIDLPYRIEGAYLQTTRITPRLHYTAYNATISAWSQQLLECLVLYLAAQIAFTLTQKPEIAAELLREYESFVRPQQQTLRRRTSLSQEKRARGYSWLQARKGYYARGL
jgi:hypothetical protein